MAELYAMPNASEFWWGPRAKRTGSEQEANGKDPGAKRSGNLKTKIKRKRNKIKIGYSIIGGALIFRGRSISELVVHFLHLKITIWIRKCLCMPLRGGALSFKTRNTVEDGRKYNNW
jgi:hypothetical protein